MSKEYEDQMLDETNDQDKGSSFSAIKVVLITLGVLILLVVTAVGAGGYYIYANIQPADPQAEELIHIEVPMGSSATRIASILKENNIIKHEKLFYYYVRYKGEGGFQAGEYFLSANMELDDIINQLKEGRIYLESQRFTIAEGLSLQQIAMHLEAEGLVDQEVFLQLLEEGDFSDIAVVAEIPRDVEHRRLLLEGFLFPETYEIHKGATEEDIVRLLLNQFNKEWLAIQAELDQQSPEWREEMERRELTFYDIVTLASIIEREAVLGEERSTIAGVFLNRMDDGWLLQSCATVQFVLGKQRERILYADLEVDDPYNTYIYEGLPPGPIASPGRASIKAALAPEQHDYFFFVTKKDGTGAHHFARTYQEHLANDAQSRGNF